MRGKNKAGRHHLRQIGIGLLVARDLRLPLYYSVYPGNIHDSKHFEAVMEEMFGAYSGLNKTKERLTVVFDKGMNGDENYAWIDEHSGDGLSMSFRKNAYLVERRQSMFGKNIIITDNMDWTTVGSYDQSSPEISPGDLRCSLSRKLLFDQRILGVFRQGGSGEI
jgi:transposase